MRAWDISLDKTLLPRVQGIGHVGAGMYDTSM